MTPGGKSFPRLNKQQKDRNTLRRRIFSLLLTFLLCLSGCTVEIQTPPATLEAAALETASLEARYPSPPEGPPGAPELVTDEHIPYLFPDENGCILPEELVTRGAACEMLYTLMKNPVEGDCSFSDVSPEDSCYDAVACLAAWGIISDSASEFQPDGLLSRAQLVTMLSTFYPVPRDGEAPYVGSFLRRSANHTDAALLPQIPSFSDIAGHWAEAAIENAVTRGWVEPGGKFYPDTALTRAQFCQILNRVLGRSGDAAMTLLSDDYEAFPDAGVDNLYYADIMEASQSHEYETVNGLESWRSEDLEPGSYLIDGKLVYVSENGTILRGQSLGHLDFGPDGFYSCGDAEVDGMIDELLRSCTTEDMTRDEMLEAAFTHIRCYYIYIPASQIHKPTELDHGDTDFEVPWAESCLRRGGGDCVGMASTFCLAARALGYQAITIFGQYRPGRYDHCWVIIPEDGVDYLYDPQQAQDNDNYSAATFYRFRDGYPYTYYYESYYPNR